jgi:antitoxin component of MazEF toxin-antitoxin module
MPQKIFKTGNSLAVTVPSQFVQALGLHPGATVKTKLEISKLKITYEFSGTRQLPLLKSDTPSVKDSDK